MLEDGLIIFIVSVVGMKSAKDLLGEENCSNFAIKRSSVWQTHDLKRRNREKQHIVWVEIKLISIL